MRILLTVENMWIVCVPNGTLRQQRLSVKTLLKETNRRTFDVIADYRSLRSCQIVAAK
jgi:hypothetical protein